MEPSFFTQRPSWTQRRFERYHGHKFSSDDERCVKSVKKGSSSSLTFKSYRSSSDHSQEYITGRQSLERSPWTSSQRSNIARKTTPTKQEVKRTKKSKKDKNFQQIEINSNVYDSNSEVPTSRVESNRKLEDEFNSIIYSNSLLGEIKNKNVAYVNERKEKDCQSEVLEMEIAKTRQDIMFGTFLFDVTRKKISDKFFDALKIEKHKLIFNSDLLCRDWKDDQFQVAKFLEFAICQKVPQLIRNKFNTDVTNPRKYQTCALEQITYVANNPEDNLKLVSKRSQRRVDSNKSLQKQIPTQNLKVQISLQEDSCILILGGINSDLSVLDEKLTGRELWRFSPRENEWQAINQLPESRILAAAVYLSGFVYLMGGCVPANNIQLMPLSTVWKLSVSNGQWSMVEPMIYSRMYHGACDCTGFVYAVGGNGKGGELLSSVECYNPKSDQWSEITPLTSARMCMGIGVIKGHIWVCGGFEIDDKNSNNYKITDNVESYCPQIKRWKKLPPLLNPRCCLSITSLKGNLCVVGGSTKYESEGELVNCGDIDAFDIENNCWKNITTLEFPRHGAVALTLGDHIHVIGGVASCEDNLSIVECFSAKCGEFVSGVATLKEHLIAMTGVVIPRARVSEVE